MGWHRWYWVSDSITEQYLFETQDGKNLWEVVSICYDSKIPHTEAQKYLTKRNYTFLFHKDAKGDTPQYDAYESKDKKTAAALFLYNEGKTWLLDFLPNEEDVWDEE